MQGQTYVELENKCKNLTRCGSCGIYPDRPKACIIYEVGSQACIQTIKTRRADQADAIIRLIKWTEELKKRYGYSLFR